MQINQDYLSISFPLTLSMLKEAKQRSQITHSPSQQQSIYLNELAVKVVHFYCQCMGIATTLTSHNQWESLQQTVWDESKLLFNSGEILECRPILPHQTAILLPLETQSNRVAYLLVEIDDILRKGTILGFSFPPAQNILERQNIRPLTDFLQFCQRFILSPSDYLEKLFKYAGDWQQPEEILVPDYRRIPKPSLPQQTEISPSQKVRKGKVIQLEQRKIAIIIHLTWISANEINFYARVHPMDNLTTLTVGLQIYLKDSQQNILLHKIANVGDNCLRLSHPLPDDHQLSLLIHHENQKIQQKIAL